MSKLGYVSFCTQSEFHVVQFIRLRAMAYQVLGEGRSTGGETSEAPGESCAPEQNKAKPDAKYQSLRIRWSQMSRADQVHIGVCRVNDDLLCEALLILEDYQPEENQGS